MLFDATTNVVEYAALESGELLEVSVTEAREFA